MSKIKMADYGYPIINKLINFLPNNYLEIGIFSGEGIKEIAINNKNKTCYAVDPFIEDGCTVCDSKVGLNEKMVSQREITLNNIFGVPNIVLYELKSKEFRDTLLTDELIKKLNIDSVFVDGDHSYQCCFDDIELALKLIADKKGIIFVDDFDLPSVSLAVKDILIKHQNIYDYGMTTKPRDTFKFYFVN
jgi:hypothetical protein